MKVTPRVMGRHSILEKCYKTRIGIFFFFFCPGNYKYFNKKIRKQHTLELSTPRKNSF